MYCSTPARITDGRGRVTVRGRPFAWPPAIEPRDMFDERDTDCSDIREPREPREHSGGSAPEPDAADAAPPETLSGVGVSRIGAGAGAASAVPLVEASSAIVGGISASLAPGISTWTEATSRLPRESRAPRFAEKVSTFSIWPGGGPTGGPRRGKARTSAAYTRWLNFMNAQYTK